MLTALRTGDISPTPVLKTANTEVLATAFSEVGFSEDFVADATHKLVHSFTNKVIVKTSIHIISP